jgi:hypothetical protein
LLEDFFFCLSTFWLKYSVSCLIGFFVSQERLNRKVCGKPIAKCVLLVLNVFGFVDFTEFLAFFLSWFLAFFLSWFLALVQRSEELKRRLIDPLHNPLIAISASTETGSLQCTRSPFLLFLAVEIQFLAFLVFCLLLLVSRTVMRHQHLASFLLFRTSEELKRRLGRQSWAHLFDRWPYLRVLKQVPFNAHPLRFCFFCVCATNRWC